MARSILLSWEPEYTASFGLPASSGAAVSGCLTSINVWKTRQLGIPYTQVQSRGQTLDHLVAPDCYYHHQDSKNTTHHCQHSVLPDDLINPGYIPPSSADFLRGISRSVCSPQRSTYSKTLPALPSTPLTRHSLRRPRKDPPCILGGYLSNTRYPIVSGLFILRRTIS